MIDLSWILGTYNPVIDPVTGSIVTGIAGVDWVYISRLILLTIAVSSIFRAFIWFIKGR
jgi:hypothetical protein